MRWVDFLSGAALGALIVWAWLRRRRALKERIDGAAPRVDDDAVKEILRRGVLDLPDDDPLDLDEIARAERDFWETEGWDPAE